MVSHPPNPPAIVLASTSPYRRELLERLGLPFIYAGPRVDETPAPGEDPHGLVRRLAEAKARSLAASHPGALIIGSDQVAVLPDGSLLNKPGDHALARTQLRRCSGAVVTFLTGLCLLDTRTATARVLVVPGDVVFRELSDAEIERYLLAEQPYDCAGAFKSERMGIALLAELRLPDPTALIGLPLIALSALLREAGVPVP